MLSIGSVMCDVSCVICSPQKEHFAETGILCSPYLICSSGACRGSSPKRPAHRKLSTNPGRLDGGSMHQRMYEDGHRNLVKRRGKEARGLSLVTQGLNSLCCCRQAVSPAAVRTRTRTGPIRAKYSVVGTHLSAPRGHLSQRWAGKADGIIPAVRVWLAYCGSPHSRGLRVIPFPIRGDGDIKPTLSVLHRPKTENSHGNSLFGILWVYCLKIPGNCG
jgi:hypothetical protein